MLCCETMPASDVKRKLKTNGGISARKSANVQRDSDPVIRCFEFAKYHDEEARYRRVSSEAHRESVTVKEQLILST